MTEGENKIVIERQVLIMLQEVTVRMLLGGQTGHRNFEFRQLANRFYFSRTISRLTLGFIKPPNEPTPGLPPRATASGG